LWIKQRAECLAPPLTVLRTAARDCACRAGVPAVAGKSQLHDFPVWNKRSPDSTALGANSSRPETRNVVGFAGDGAMWIIWYVGMMASLRAMGLAPSLVPIKIDEDRKPFGDM